MNLFVYGTLCDKSLPKDYYVNGYLYDVGRFPAIIVDRDGPKVYGQVFTGLDSAQIDYLDLIEAVPHMYKRIATVAIKDGETIDVNIYEWNRPTDGLDRITEWPRV